MRTKEIAQTSPGALGWTANGCEGWLPQRWDIRAANPRGIVALNHTHGYALAATPIAFGGAIGRGTTGKEQDDGQADDRSLHTAATLQTTHKCVQTWTFVRMVSKKGPLVWTMLALLACWLPTPLPAQNTLLKTYDADTLNAARRLARTPDGGFLMTGHYRVSTDVLRLTLMKLDALGDLQWSRKYGELPLGAVATVLPLTTQGAIVLTATLGNSFTGQDLVAMRIDDAGDTLWVRAYDHPRGVLAMNAVELADGDLVLVSYTAEGFYLTRITDQGSMVWTNGYFGTTAPAGWFQDPRAVIMLASDSTLVVCGALIGHGAADANAFIMRTDLQGSVIWARSIGTGVGDMFKEVFETPEGGFLAVGYMGGTSVDFPSTFAVKLDAAGNLLWSKEYPASVNDRCSFLETCSDGNYVIGGHLGGSPVKGHLLKITGTGDLLWSNAYEMDGWNMYFHDGVAVDDGLAVSLSAAVSFSYDPGVALQDTTGAFPCTITPLPRAVLDTMMVVSDSITLVAGVSEMPYSMAYFPFQQSTSSHCVVTETHDMDIGNNGLRLWPNPAQDRLHLEAAIAGTHSWIIDATGRLLREIILPVGIATIPLTGLSNGAYALRLGTGEVLRFVKE